MNSNKSFQWLPYLLLTLTVSFWSINFVLGRSIRELIPPVSLNFWRWVSALIILAPFGLPRIRHQFTLLRKHWKMLAWMSIPSVTFFNTFIYKALQSTTTTNTALVNAMTPIFIALTAWAVFRERMGKRQFFGVLVSLIGLVFIVTRGDPGLLMRLDFSGGDLWTLGAALSWAIYSVMLRRLPVRMDPIAFLTTIVIMGLVALLPFYLWELRAKGGFGVSVASIGSIAYLGLFPSVLSYIFWNRGVGMVGANRAGIFIHLMPVFAILLASVFLDEQMRLYHLAGMVMIFSGIALTTYPVRRE